jgi:hypothetical protein
VQEQGDPPPLVLLCSQNLFGQLTVGFGNDRGSLR